MNGQVKVTCRILSTITHYLMVHTKVLEPYIHFAFMYTTDHIYPVLPIKDMINKEGNPTTPFKLATGTSWSDLTGELHFRVVCHPHRTIDIYVFSPLRWS